MKKLIFQVSLGILLSFMLFVNSECLAETTPSPPSGFIESDHEYIISGNYQYQILDEKEKKIVLRKISNYEEKVVIPNKINGYTVSILGYPGHEDDLKDLSKANIFQENDTIVKSLVIPKGITVIGIYAMNNLKALESVDFPDSLLKIKDGAFSGCSRLKKIEIPKNTTLDYCSFGECYGLKKVILHTRFLDEGVFNSNIGTLIIAKDVGYNINIGYGLTGCKIENVYVKKGVKEIRLSDSHSVNYIKRLYIEDPKTIITHKDNLIVGSLKVGKVITVPKAKAITYARKRKITYDVVKIPQVTNIKRVRKKSSTKFTWNKVKTISITNQYEKAKKKWVATKKKKNNSYQVFVANNKTGEYYYKKTVFREKVAVKGKAYVKIKLKGF